MTIALKQASLPGLIITLLLLVFSTLQAAHIIQYIQASSYDNIPITPKTWEEVDLAYTDMIKGKQYTNSMQLLRPIKWLKQHHMGKVGEYVTLSMPEFGINQVSARIQAIKPDTFDSETNKRSSNLQKPVIGRFMHYTTDVRTYHFKGEGGQILPIHATPNHPFYVQNKHGFIAIKDIKDTDRLVGKNGQKDDVIHLICTHLKHSHCGMAYGQRNSVKLVYNLEIQQSHRYSVSADGLIVHNWCQDAIVQDMVMDKAASIIQSKWRAYRNTAYLMPDMVLRRAASLGSADVEIDSLSPGDIFVRTRFADDPAHGHSGIYLTIKNNRYRDQLILQALDISGGNNPRGYRNLMRPNLNYHAHPEYYLATHARLIEEAADWFNRGRVIRLYVSPQSLRMPILQEQYFSISTNQSFGIGYNCHTFISNVLSRLRGGG